MLRTKDFIIKKIDEISAKSGSSTRKFSERVKILYEKLDEFVKSQMEKINREFHSQLNLMKKYLDEIKTLSLNKDGFYDNKEHEFKAS